MQLLRTCFFALLAGQLADGANVDRRKRLNTFPIVQFVREPTINHGLKSRGVESLDLANRSDIAYYARLDFGIPAQPQFVLLDTGSYELWINPDCTTLRNNQDGQFCKALGRYDAGTSSTAASLGGGKTLQYGKGNVTFGYYTDTVGLAGSSAVKLQNLQFGVATESEDALSGILGLGYGNGFGTKYPTFIDQLAGQSFTETAAFSVALGGKDEDSGVVMFGGLDTSKFSGSLRTIPLISAASSPDGSPRYWVRLNSIGSSARGKISEKKTYETSRNMTVFLDAGSTLTRLPRALAMGIAADFGSQGPDGDGQFIVDCAMARVNRTLDFAFDGGVTIRVPYPDVVREFGGTTGGQKTCYLGIGVSDTYTPLGASFLRSAYVVFDQTNHALHVAQYANCGTREVEITKGFRFDSLSGDCELPAGLDRPQEAVSNTTSDEPPMGPSAPVSTSGGVAGSGASRNEAALNGWRHVMVLVGCLGLGGGVLHGAMSN